MPLLRLLQDAAFSPEEIQAMVQAYDTVRRKLHDRGQPEAVNEIIAKRIIELAKLKTLNSEELAARVLNLFGLPSD
jgi:hypothetical protein